MYNHCEIEKKWQSYWESHHTFRTVNDSTKEKFYVLDMFPYPSGAGLHVGHPEGYTANDIVARYKHAKGYNVLHPMGWDAFGLPAENYAIKTGIHPRITTQQNIATFKRQIQSLGFSYDWEREIDTTDPKYFQWTQWIFLKLFEAGLAYEQDLPINYCPSCKTGLANEEVLADFSCERCGTQVEKRKIRQWVLAITKYAERLLKDVDDLDWPEGIKDMQRNWIGKSEGINITYQVVGSDKTIDCFTTTPVNFGLSFIVLGPEHPLIEEITTPENLVSVREYIKITNSESEQDRLNEGKEKTGVFTGSYAVNHLTNQYVPIWVADFVLGHVGTGAVQGCPGHDARDFDFAKKYNLPIYRVVESETGKKDKVINPEIETVEYVKSGKGILRKMCNSDFLNGVTFDIAMKNTMDYFESHGWGKRVTNYKLRDWLFSRQRYWGEPIPLIHISHTDYDALPRISDMSDMMEADTAYIYDKKTLGKRCKNCTCGDIGCVKLVINGKSFSRVYDGIYGKIICDYRLPLELPQVDAYEPAGDGQSPLVKVPEFVNVQLAKNLSGKRETNTMPQWGGSCWYYLRFMDAKNPEELVSKAAENYWGSVDSYVGGAEHAVLHLLYARFWHKFLYDTGVVSTTEPFHRLRNQGMILAYAYERQGGGLVAVDLIEEKGGKFFETSTGEEVKRVVAKMSKSLKNVVNPDDIVKEYGADTLRLYEMYMGDFADTKPWDTTAIVGCSRFLDRVSGLFLENKEKYAPSDSEAMKMLHKTIKKVGIDIENYKFNTAIAQLMICLNMGEPRDEKLQKEWKKSFLILLHPFAPHITEECWQKIQSSSFRKVYFATGNTAKIERLQKLISGIDGDFQIEAYSELIDVEETGKTALECALQKLAVYEGKKLDAPILTADTSVHFEGQGFDPTRVRRAAIEQAGKKESELSREEIGILMRDFYQDIARKAGGKIAFHYTDAFAILSPDGSKKTYQYTRPYYLTDTIFGELDYNIPMRCLYISQITGKTAYNTTDEDYEKEFAAQKDMALELFGFGNNSIFFAEWPDYDEAMTIDNEVTIGVQVLGKLRGEIMISVSESQQSVLAKARANPDVMRWTEGKEIVKEIYVPGKIVNIVIK